MKTEKSECSLANHNQCPGDKAPTNTADLGDVLIHLGAKVLQGAGLLPKSEQQSEPFKFKITTTRSGSAKIKSKTGKVKALEELKEELRKGGECRNANSIKKLIDSDLTGANDCANENRVTFLPEDAVSRGLLDPSDLSAIAVKPRGHECPLNGQGTTEAKVVIIQDCIEDKDAKMCYVTINNPYTQNLMKTFYIKSNPHGRESNSIVNGVKTIDFGGCLPATFKQTPSQLEKGSHELVASIIEKGKEKFEARIKQQQNQGQAR